MNLFICKFYFELTFCVICTCISYQIWNGAQLFFIKTSLLHFYTDEINVAAHSIVTQPNCDCLIVNSIHYIYPPFISVIASLVQKKTHKLTWRDMRGVESRFYSPALLGSHCTLGLLEWWMGRLVFEHLWLRYLLKGIHYLNSVHRRLGTLPESRCCSVGLGNNVFYLSRAIFNWIWLFLTMYRWPQKY